MYVTSLKPREHFLNLSATQELPQRTCPRKKFNVLPAPPVTGDVARFRGGSSPGGAPNAPCSKTKGQHRQKQTILFPATTVPGVRRNTEETGGRTGEGREEVTAVARLSANPPLRADLLSFPLSDSRRFLRFVAETGRAVRGPEVPGESGRSSTLLKRRA